MKEFILRKWHYDDAENIADAADNPNIAKYLRNTFPSPYTLDDAKWYVNDCITKEGIGQITRAIEVDGKAVGSIGIFLKDDVLEKTAELGYWLSEEYWGLGIMPEAVMRICAEAFSCFDILRVYAEPFENNLQSKRVLEKAGFTYEGTMRNGICKNREILSYCMYSVLKNEVRINCPSLKESHTGR